MKILIAIPISFSLCSSLPGTTTEEPVTSSTDSPLTTSTTSTSNESTTSAETTEVPTTGEPCPVGSMGCPCTGGGACDKGLTCDDAGICGEGFSPPCDPSVNMDDCCGDGVLDDFEECDMAAGNGDSEPCTSRCRHAFCGDGVVLEGVEACDSDPDCRDDCTLKSCGNGVVDHPDEDCDSLRPDDPECTPLCKDGRKIIFVSSEHYKGGEIGGIAGGDEKCQALADAEGLTGEFKSWLATSEDDAPFVRFTWADVPYVDVNGVLIAETWNTIYSNSGSYAPYITEQGFQFAPSEVEYYNVHSWAWASQLTQPGGSNADPSHCGKWSDVAERGSAANIDPNADEEIFGGSFRATWGGADCNLSAPVICVEQ